MLTKNSLHPFEIIAEGSDGEERVKYHNLWHDLESKYNG